MGPFLIYSIKYKIIFTTILFLSNFSSEIQSIYVTIMQPDKNKLIKEYLVKVKSANKELTKKEAFKDLLNRLYASDREILRIVDKITLGAETTILNIPRKDKLHRGSADTLYNKIIIEFENDLKVTREHAKEQLAGYMLGQFKSGEGYNFTLIASDFITWEVYAPDVECLDKLNDFQEDEIVLNEIKSSKLTLTEKNTEDFYYWIDRFLFKEEKQKATLKRIEEAFGYQSHVFIESYRELSSWFNEAKKYGEVQVSLEQWNKFLSIAYGVYDGSDKNFLVHTYLSIFAKMLAYSVVSNDDYIDDKEMLGILNGDIFNRYRIYNFVDNDFFHWVSSERNFKQLKNVFRLIAQEISSFDYTDVDEDILKGVYQELIDLDTRHALGEYYTPDWLCERIVAEFDFKPTDKILDPACGSGSFLRAAIHRFKSLHPEMTAEEINNNIYGIDIHPLSVQIAKTTILLTIGKDFSEIRNPIHVNITLANTLLAPENNDLNIFDENFVLGIDNEKYPLTTQILENMSQFDNVVEMCDELAKQTMNKEAESLENFNSILTNQFTKLNKTMINSYYTIYEGLKKVKEDGRDSIWKFIVQNLYKPYFLSDKFEFIIGNPPWFTYSDIKNEDYQNVLSSLAIKYDVKPQRVANFPHLEIAAIFLAYCSGYFLKENGKIAFVLPRSFFSADHHDNTRSGIAKGFKINSLWDLIGTVPLFRVPSCVIIADKASNDEKRSILKSGIDGLSLSGKLNEQNCNLAEAKNLLNEEKVKWYYVKQGASTAFSLKNTKPNTKENPYKKLFKQGATIVPRSFYFVELEQEMPEDFSDSIINIKTSQAIQADAKTPWKGIELKGMIESRFIFRTALSKSILPFALYNPDLVVLPAIIEMDDNDKKKIKLYSSNDLRHEGFLKASKWFGDAENIWSLNKSAKSKDMTTIGRIDFQRGVTEQNLNAKYLVLYNSSAKDANATIVKRDELDLEFLVESVTYVLYTDDISEAYYLTGILNSSIPNEIMKDFQAKGMFGERHVHKKILDIYYPRYDENEELHVKLAALSEEAHKKAAEFAKNNPQQNTGALSLGRMRLAIKKHIAKEMKEIDKIVKKIIK